VKNKLKDDLAAWEEQEKEDPLYKWEFGELAHLYGLSCCKGEGLVTITKLATKRPRRSRPTIYGHLKALKSAGWVREVKGTHRFNEKGYEITTKGKAAFDEYYSMMMPNDIFYYDRIAERLGLSEKHPAKIKIFPRLTESGTHLSKLFLLLDIWRFYYNWAHRIFAPKLPFKLYFSVGSITLFDEKYDGETATPPVIGAVIKRKFFEKPITRITLNRVKTPTDI
jgi:DNA-binding PadR family transcriptional regulator